MKVGHHFPDIIIFILSLKSYSLMAKWEPQFFSKKASVLKGSSFIVEDVLGDTSSL